MNTRSLKLIVGLAPIPLLLLVLLTLSGAVRIPTRQAADTQLDTVPLTGTATLPPFTPTRTSASDNALSVLATPTPTQMESPLAASVANSQTFTLTVEAIATTVSASSPLATPTSSTTATIVVTALSSPTTSALTATRTAAETSPALIVTPTATDHIVTIVVTLTPMPLALVGPRPLEFPTPTPTSDYVLVAAEVFDAAMITAGWIWFLLGSLVFFVTAGVVAGLWFRQQERRRYDLIDDEGQDLDLDRFTPLPTVAIDDAPDDEWPDSLP